MYINLRLICESRSEDVKAVEISFFGVVKMVYLRQHIIFSKCYVVIFRYFTSVSYFLYEYQMYRSVTICANYEILHCVSEFQ